MTIQGKNLNVYYGENQIIKDINFTADKGKILSIIGPNGSGKTTLIKALTRNVKLHSGEILLNGKDIYSFHNKEVARELAVLPQIKSVTEDITVEELVAYGRYPHLGFGKRIEKKDKEIISRAINKTGLKGFEERYVRTLSGGEGQRAWIAMALAQEPKILFLDEPTNHLDISYQMEVLELIKELNKSLGLTVIMVVHDLNQACRYSDEIYVLNNGEVYKKGKANEVLNSELLREVFRIEAHVYKDNVNNCPYFIAHRIHD